MVVPVKLAYLSPVPYASFAQRPHRFVDYFNRLSGGRTLWINPYPGRLPQYGDLRRLLAPRRGLRGEAAVRFRQSPYCATASVTVYSVVGCDPLMSFGAAQHIFWKRAVERVREFVGDDDWLLAIGRPSYLALHLLGAMGPRTSCYDAMDDFPEFYSGLSRWFSRKVEERIAESVHTILVTSEGLRRKFARRGYNVELLRNGFDAEWTAELQGAPPPAPVCGDGGSGREESRHAEPQGVAPDPVFGYVGTLGAWFDWELVRRMALQLPEVRFDLIGPVRSSVPPLPRNVGLRGECGHGDVPSKLRGFTAGLIPFKVNTLTAAVDPLKYYEYRACGLPVVSSAFGDMARLDAQPGLYLVDLRTDYRRLFGHIVSEPRLSGDLLHQFRTENSWGSRFARSAFFHAQVIRAAVDRAD